MNLTLYEIAAEYADASRRLADLDLPPEVVADTLESIGGELQEKATNVAFVIRDMEATAAAIAAAEMQMAVRRKAIERRAEWLRDYLRHHMEQTNIARIDTPWFRMSVRSNPPAVEIIDERQIPAEYMTTPPPVVDKTSIRKAISSGQDVPGAKLIQKTRLEIR